MTRFTIGTQDHQGSTFSDQAIARFGLSIAAAAVAAFVSLGAANGAAAQSTSPDVPVIKWDTTLNKFQFDKDKFIGQRFTAKCPASTVHDTFEGVYGTDVYPSKNPLCVAALHAGQITKDGGLVTVQLNPGETEYTGSSRNGVETASLPGTPRSMVFIDATAAETGGAESVDKIHVSYAPVIEWDTKFTRSGFAHKQLIGQNFTFNCPAAPHDMRARRVVGTDTYAYSSSICRAAVHAGAITTDGGFVTVQMGPGTTKLVGSIRNGVETHDGPSGIRSITFVDSSV